MPLIFQLAYCAQGLAESRGVLNAIPSAILPGNVRHVDLMNVFLIKLVLYLMGEAFSGYNAYSSVNIF